MKHTKFKMYIKKKHAFLDYTEFKKWRHTLKMKENYESIHVSNVLVKLQKPT